MRIRPLLLLACSIPAAGAALAQESVVPGKQAPAAPAAAGDEQTRVPSEFARFVRVGDGGRLNTAVTRYRGKDGVEVTLFAAVHIADPGHYQELQKRFAAQEALLFEMVGPEDYRPRPGETGGSFVSILQRMLKAGLELEFQLDGIDYRQDNFVHADLSPKEFKEKMEERGESLLGLLWNAMQSEMRRAREAAEKGEVDPDLKALAELDLVAAFRKGEGRHTLRMLFGSQMQEVERLAAGFSSGDKGSVLVEGRNEKCLEVLQREIKAGKKKLGIYYGAAHMPHIEQRMTKDLGFAKVGHEWLQAWDCTKRPDKKPADRTPPAGR